MGMLLMFLYFLRSHSFMGVNTERVGQQWLSNSTTCDSLFKAYGTHTLCERSLKVPILTKGHVIFLGDLVDDYSSSRTCKRRKERGYCSDPKYSNYQCIETCLTEDVKE